MAYAKKIVLHCKAGYKIELDELIEKFLIDRVQLVAVCGVNCEKVHDIIDEIVVGNGSDSSRELLTSFHPDNTLVEVMEFAKNCLDEWGEQIDLVVLG